ncbi:MAG: ComF family protein [bacterium]
MKLLKWLKDGLFPVNCVGCGKEDVLVCGDCLSGTPFFVNRGCFVCAEEGKWSLGRCPSCEKLFLSGVWSVAPYSHPVVKGIIRGLKFSHASELRAALETLINRGLTKFSALMPFSSGTIVVPIPTTPRRFRERGFDQVEWIAEVVSRGLRLPLRSVIRIVKEHNRQSLLQTLGARQKNIAGSFGLQGDVRGKTVILVDDVITSGATMQEIARVLREAGAAEVWGFTLARSGRKMSG